MEDVAELLREGFLVVDDKQARHVIVMLDSLRLVGRKLEKDISRKKRFLKFGRFSAVLVSGAITGERYSDFFPLAILFKPFFPPRPGMRNEPRQRIHRRSMTLAPAASRNELRRSSGIRVLT